MLKLILLWTIWDNKDNIFWSELVNSWAVEEEEDDNFDKEDEEIHRVLKQKRYATLSLNADITVWWKHKQKQTQRQHVKGENAIHICTWLKETSSSSS